MNPALQEILQALRNKWPDQFPRTDLSIEEYHRLRGVHEAIQFIEQRAERDSIKSLARGRIT